VGRETPCALLVEKLDGLVIQRIVFDYECGKACAPSADANVWRLTEKDVIPPRATVRFQSLNDALLVHGVEWPNFDYTTNGSYIEVYIECSKMSQIQSAWCGKLLGRNGLLRITATRLNPAWRISVADLRRC
jgi:hypothetical protein